jgi:hypothetical protein
MRISHGGGGARCGCALRACLEDVEELEGLHLEAEVAVHEQQHKVRKLGGINLRKKWGAGVLASAPGARACAAAVPPARGVG